MGEGDGAQSKRRLCSSYVLINTVDYGGIAALNALLHYCIGGCIFQYVRVIIHF